MIQKKRAELIEQVEKMPLDELEEFCRDGNKNCDFKFLQPILHKRLPPKFVVNITASIEKQKDINIPTEIIQQMLPDIYKQLSGVVRVSLRDLNNSMPWRFTRRNIVKRTCHEKNDRIDCHFIVELIVPQRMWERYDYDFDYVKEEFTRELPYWYHKDDQFQLQNLAGEIFKYGNLEMGDIDLISWKK